MGLAARPAGLHCFLHMHQTMLLSAGKLKIAKATCDQLLLALPPPPLPQRLEVPDSLPLLKQFQQPTSKLQWSHVQGADLFLPGSVHYLIMHLPMSHSRKLVHDSAEASTSQISPSKRCVQSP